MVSIQSSNCTENVSHKLWDMNKQCDSVIVERKPDIVLNKMEKTAIIVDVVIPGHKRTIDQEKEKIEKYQNFKRDSKTLEP